MDIKERAPDTKLAPDQWPLYMAESLGNKFFIIDENGREPFRPTPSQIRDLSKWAKGFDQLLSVRPAPEDSARAVNAPHIYVSVWNKDGSPAENCGNGVRCIAHLAGLGGLGDTIEEHAGNLIMSIGTQGTEMRGDCPIARGRPIEGYYHEHECKSLFFYPKVIKENPSAYVDKVKNYLLNDSNQQSVVKDVYYVDIGNPHIVLSLKDGDPLELASKYGATLETQLNHDGHFRNGVNINFAKQKKQDKNYNRTIVDLQVWERGAGLTDSCSTGAAAVYVALSLDSGSMIQPAKMKFHDKSGQVNPHNAFHCAVMDRFLSIQAETKINKRDFILFL